MARKDKIEDIKSHSEDVQEVLSDVPNWILRWGITLVFIIVVVILVGSYFFKYPDTISANMTLTGTIPPIAIVSKTNGPLKELNISDGQYVEKGTYLGVVENPAYTEDLILLKHQLETLILHPDSILNFRYNDLKLGNVQVLYTSFLRALNNYQKFVELGYYPQKITSIRGRINQYEHYYSGMVKQSKIAELQYNIAKTNFYRDSLLNEKKILSNQDIDNAQNQYLQSRLTLESSYSSLENLQLQMSQLHETLLDTDQQYMETKNTLESELNTVCMQLINEIKTWEINYALIAPISGQISFTTYWSENQQIVAGETVFTIIPHDKTNLIGKALLPIARSGKVKKGQSINIYFSNFPDQEFGMVRGIVKTISLVPINENYIIEVALPNGLNTTYNKELPYLPEMQARADIITDDLSLLKRFLMPLRKIWKEGIQ